jgi:hypothetical protein
VNIESVLKNITDYITAQSEVIPDEITGTALLPPADSINIYRNDYLARMQSVLMENFPMTHWVLGDELFLPLSQDYVRRTPSIGWDINVYGEHFPQFIQDANIEVIVKNLPFIFELASFERANLEFFHQAPPPKSLIPRPTTPDDFAKLTPPANLKIFSSAYNIPKIYQAAQQKQTLLPEQWRDPKQNPTQNHSCYFLYKRDHQTRIEELSETQHLVLNLWLTYGSLGELITQWEKSSVSADDPVITCIGPLLDRLFELHLL